MKRTWTDEQLIEAVKTSISIAEVLRKLNLITAGGSYTHIKSHIIRLNLDTTHMLGEGWLKEKSHNFSKSTPALNLMIEDSAHKFNKKIKKYLIKNKLLPYECSICKINEWKNKPLMLQLDHINGINSDNRIENLRLLCPNCHSQTDTFTGNNIRNRKIVNKNKCLDCGVELSSKKFKRCRPCDFKLRKFRLYENSATHKQNINNENLIN